MPTFRSHAPRRYPIGLTALIDVVFILLIFFMLASSFIDWRAIELKLPPAADAGAAGGLPLIVSMENGGALWLEGERIARTDLGMRLAERLSEDDGYPVLVRVAGNVPLQRTIEVLETVTEAGARNVSLAHGGRAEP